MTEKTDIKIEIPFEQNGEYYINLKFKNNSNMDIDSILFVEHLIKENTEMIYFGNVSTKDNFVKLLGTNTDEKELTGKKQQNKNKTNEQFHINFKTRRGYKIYEIKRMSFFINNYSVGKKKTNYYHLQEISVEIFQKDGTVIFEHSFKPFDFLKENRIKKSCILLNYFDICHENKKWYFTEKKEFRESIIENIKREKLGLPQMVIRKNED